MLLTGFFEIVKIVLRADWGNCKPCTGGGQILTHTRARARDRDTVTHYFSHPLG